MAAATSPGRAPAGTTATARPGWMGRHPLAAFLLLCFGLTWACLLPLAADSHGWLPFHAPRWLLLPAGWGPALAAWPRLVRGGAAGAGRPVRRGGRPRHPAGWHAADAARPRLAAARDAADARAQPADQLGGDRLARVCPAAPARAAQSRRGQPGAGRRGG